jgi:hypothetical protein
MNLPRNSIAKKWYVTAGVLILGLSACAPRSIPTAFTHSGSMVATADISTNAPISGPTLTAQAMINVGAFDLHWAMELLYGGEGNLETSPQGEVMVRIPRAPGSEQDQDQIIRILLATNYREAGEDKYVVLTETGPEGMGAHAAVAQIGGAIFHWTAHAWQIEIQQRSITSMGSFGHAPGGDLVNIGSDKHGFLFQPMWVGQGSESQYATLIGIAGPTFRIIFQHEIFIHSEVEDTVWEYSAEMDFLPGGNPEYYDIRITTRGTKPAAGEVKPFEMIEEFVFNGQEYVLKDSG